MNTLLKAYLFFHSDLRKNLTVWGIDDKSKKMYFRTKIIQTKLCIAK